ncbi:MAG: hypothetical protein QUU85_17470 [Candidatus Eisenbacteria bacterium]|nr:hypothetical protein [Candidatus Eisenbacteria bacterium]
MRFHRADGTASQRWYRSEDLPAGTVIAGLPYRMESLAAEFRLGLIAAL